MTDPLQGWARQVAALPAAIVRATPGAVTAGAGVLEEAARSNLRTASGGDLFLSRVRSGKGARVDVQVKASGAGSTAAAAVLPVGPVSLLEGDTRPHREPFAYLAARTGGERSYSMARRRKASRRGFLSIPGVGVRQSARHPGTRGQHPVGRAFDTSHDRAGQAGAQVFMAAVASHMKR